MFFVFFLCGKDALIKRDYGVYQQGVAVLKDKCRKFFSGYGSNLITGT